MKNTLRNSGDNSRNPDEFFRFPHTPHIAWLGDGRPRDDKVLGADEVAALLSAPVVVEEKIDGANLGFSVDRDGRLQVQNRGQYLNEPYSGQFQRLPEWISVHGAVLTESLQSRQLIAFGEWCAARHSLDYSALPDWWLLFDIYDRQAGRFWSTRRRNEFADAVRVPTVTRLVEGHQTEDSLKRILSDARSRFREGAPEGLVVRREDESWLLARGKLVRTDFIQTIDKHWRSRKLEWNRVLWAGSKDD
ncbi:MAG: ligase [Achromobacter mucicolens]|uniref:RNA ligase family protein n=1 Tax=Achromobacter mucicolens TaxID=1389922 RepID=UPI00242E02F4|nr:RNA ligase family protein [Achromobacter mucicolens]MDF2864757.1 ligase [Achromobacter mucicolens]